MSGWSMPKAKKAKHTRRRSSKGGKQSMMKLLGGIGLASGLIGLAEQSKLLDNLPPVPLIGRKGLVAVGAALLHHYGSGGELTKNIAVAATALATYQLGRDNKIDGYDY